MKGGKNEGHFGDPHGDPGRPSNRGSGLGIWKSLQPNFRTRRDCRRRIQAPNAGKDFSLNVLEVNVQVTTTSPDNPGDDRKSQSGWVGVTGLPIF